MGEVSQGRHIGSDIGSQEVPNDSGNDVTRTRELTCPAKSCTAAGHEALHVAHEARGDRIGKREKVVWVARDRQDKG